jgi:hypothetical protein
MGLRYRQEYNETGDVLDPQPYNYNQNELISEFNGRLDRQNLLEQSLVRNQVVTGAFSNIRQRAELSFSTTDMTSRTWQTVLLDGFTAPVDCMCVFEFSGTTYWPLVYYGDNRQEDAVMFRIVLDGTEIVGSHFYGESAQQDAVYVVGATPVPAGVHVVSVELLFARVFHSSLQFSEDAVSSGAFVVVNPVLITMERRR